MLSSKAIAAAMSLLLLLGSAAAAGATASGEASAPAAESAGAPSRPGAVAPKPGKVQTKSRSWNDFDVSNASVSKDKIVAGGPIRDAIRSVDEPEFVDAAAAEQWVAPANTVIGLSVGDVAHAYPVHLLEYHQVVNDELAGVPVVLSYDPIAGVPLAFERRLSGRTLEFGVSGLVYQSNFLLYDRESESLWLPWTGEAIAGPMLGKRLARLRVRQEPYAAWLHRHPDSLVLARPLLKQIDYRYSPYSSYWGSETIPFPVDSTDPAYHPKEVMVGLRVDGKSRAYLGSIMVGAGGRVIDDFVGRKVRIAYDTQTSTFTWQIPEDVEVTEAYWFAWKALEPDTEVWQGLEAGPAVSGSDPPNGSAPTR
jgi:hypothetical protein